jgi:hypothetical protein
MRIDIGLMKLCQELLALLLAAALGEFLDVGRQIGLQQVAGVQLREQPDHFVLGRRVAAGGGATSVQMASIVRWPSSNWMTR